MLIGLIQAYSQQLALLTYLLKSDINHVYILDAGNLALGKQTTQSSTDAPYSSSRAVNGDYNDFTLTIDRAESRWWRVDLGNIYNFGQIKLYNRKDCCRKFNYTTCIYYNTSVQVYMILSKNKQTLGLLSLQPSFTLLLLSR